MDPVNDRAERPAGLFASLSEFWARVRAEAPKPEQFVRIEHERARQILDTREVLNAIGTSPSTPVGPPNPIATLPSGYEYRAIPAVEWAKAANLDPDVAALAWCLASEAPDIRKYPAYSVAIAEAVVNAAGGYPYDDCGAVASRVCRDRKRFDDWFFGRQSGRWCSSFQPPTMKHVKCAELVLARARAGLPNLLAGNAVGWLDPLVQLRMNKKRPATNPTPEEVIRRWARYGKEWIGPVVSATGEAIIDPMRLLLFKKTDKASALEALKAVENGRVRWRV